MVLPQWSEPAPPEQPSGASRALALVVTMLAALGLVATWSLLVVHPRGSALDESAVDGASYGAGTLWQVAEPVLDVVSIGFIIAAIAATTLVAVIRRRWTLAFQAAVLVGGANITTQLLKHLVLQRPDGALNTLPSGHTTVAASVSVALLLVVPRSARPAVALLGAVYTGATGISTMIGQWHRPSDVIAAVLVVGAFRRQRRFRARHSAGPSRLRSTSRTTAAKPPSPSRRSRSSTQSPPARFNASSATIICTSSQPWSPATRRCLRTASASPLALIRSRYSGRPPSAVTPAADRSASYWKGRTPCGILESPRWCWVRCRKRNLTY